MVPLSALIYECAPLVTKNAAMLTFAAAMSVELTILYITADSFAGRVHCDLIQLEHAAASLALGQPSTLRKPFQKYFFSGKNIASALLYAR